MKKILVIPGDGIGPEIMGWAQKLVAAMDEKFGMGLALDEVDWGAERYLREGVGIPEGELLKIPQRYDAILFGALGDPRIPDMAHGREILLGLRFGLELFINFRPIKIFEPKLSPLDDKRIRNVDIAIFRENTEDLYVGAGHSQKSGTAEEIATDESIHSYRGVHRIIDAAFKYADENRRRKVCLVDKSNAIKFGGALWQRVFHQVSKKYPHIVADHLFVDVAAMKMVEEPARFDVIVTSNLFGDILSDLGAGISGGLGLAASANINPATIGLFEPVHGSAPDIAGKDLANPFAMFLSVALMFKHLGFIAESQKIESAIVDAIKNCKCTKDLGGSLGLEQSAANIIENIVRR